MEAESTKLFCTWPEAYLAGPGLVGGKGWNLGRLARYGFSIPKGGVLATSAYQLFIQENNLTDLLEEISHNSLDDILSDNIDDKLNIIRQSIISGDFSPSFRLELNNFLHKTQLTKKSLAIRSSALAEDSSAASFAGVHDSFLNISGLENILAAIKKCYASLWTPRASAYRRKMQLADNQVLPAVVIMELIHTKASGIGFSCDPRTGRENLAVINANYGLGESVVGGIIDPDEYRLILGNAIPKLYKKRIGRKEGQTLIKSDGGTEFIEFNENQDKQVLTDKEIPLLGILIQRVFESLGQGVTHQDVEWVYDGKEFLLVQARPVTVLPIYTYPELKNQPEIWSNCNYRDIMPMVQSTLNWSGMRYNIETLMGALIKIAGYNYLDGISYSKTFAGRPYLNLSVLQWANYDCFGLTPKEINETWGGHQPEIEIREKSPYSGIKGLKRIFRTLKLIIAMQKAKKKSSKEFNSCIDYYKKWLAKGCQHLSDEELVTSYDHAIDRGKEFHPQYMLLTSLANSSTVLVKFLETSFPGQGYALTNAIMTGSGNITSAQHGYRLIELAELARNDEEAINFFKHNSFNPTDWKSLSNTSPFKQAFTKFIEEFGHRGVYELELMNPRWEEDPSYLLEIIRNSLNTANIKKIKEQQEQTSKKAWETINSLPFYKRYLVKYLLKEAITSAELREMSKSVIIRFWQIIRAIFNEAGSRFVNKGLINHPSDIYHCAYSEIFAILLRQWEGNGLKLLIEERKALREELEKTVPPDVILGEAQKIVEQQNINSSNFLVGLGVAAGQAEGIGRIITHPHEGHKLQQGDIMVVPSTDPGWTPLFLRASAIVMETGGYLSHGAIVAREFGIPAVVNIPGALKLIEEGQRIGVDGDQGKVYFIKN